MSPLRQPLGNLARLNRLRENIFFIPNQQHIVASHKAWQTRNHRTIKIKNIYYIDYESIAVPDFVEKSEKIIVCQLHIGNFVVVTQTETALTIQLTCLHSLFQSRLRGVAKPILIFCLNRCSAPNTENVFHV